MLEKTIEQYLRRKVKEVGGVAYKFSSPAHRGVPDRVCVFKDGTLIFVELKAPGKKPTPQQHREHERLRSLGQRVEVIDSKDQVNALIEELK